jgi:hypothetical protein
MLYPRQVVDSNLRSFEDAAQVIDSIAASRRAFITFGGPPPAMGHSLEDTGKKQRKRQARRPHTTRKDLK